jgi:hypothetical protein
MEDETALQGEFVLFEIPTFVGVDGLCERLRPRWPGWAAYDGDVWLVAARVEADEQDLACLLREVEAFVADSGLRAIRFSVDDRFYILEAPPLDGERHARLAG